MLISEKIRIMSGHETDGNGPCGRTNRIRHIIGTILDNYQGCMVEIGAGYGITTAALLHAAVVHNRSVVVVDPWYEEFDGGKNGYKFEDFRKVIEGFAASDSNFIEERHLFVCRFPSQASEVREVLISKKPLAFAFIDGLQTYDAVMSDLNLMRDLGCAALCVDDRTRTGVCEALNDFIPGSGYSECKLDIDNDPFEIYLVKDCEAV